MPEHRVQPGMLIRDLRSGSRDGVLTIDDERDMLRVATREFPTGTTQTVTPRASIRWPWEGKNDWISAWPRGHRHWRPSRNEPEDASFDVSPAPPAPSPDELAFPAGLPFRVGDVFSGRDATGVSQFCVTHTDGDGPPSYGLQPSDGGTVRFENTSLLRPGWRMSDTGGYMRGASFHVEHFISRGPLV